MTYNEKLSRFENFRDAIVKGDRAMIVGGYGSSRFVETEVVGVSQNYVTVLLRGEKIQFLKSNGKKKGDQGYSSYSERLEYEFQKAVEMKANKDKYDAAENLTYALRNEMGILAGQFSRSPEFLAKMKEFVSKLENNLFED